MIAADDDRRFQLAVAHHFVEGEAKLVAQAEADPADACGQALEADALLGHVEPVVQGLVVGDEFLDLGVGLVDVFRVAGQRHPAERADAAAEQRAHIGGHETGEGEGVVAANVLGHLADVVAVVEGGDALRVEGEHGFDMGAHGLLGRVARAFGVGLAALEPLLHRPALRQIAVDRIVRAGLVGNGIGAHAALDQLGQDVGGVAEQRDGFRFAGFGVFFDARQRVIEIAGLLVDVARLEAEIDAALLAFDIEAARTGE